MNTCCHSRRRALAALRALCLALALPCAAAFAQSASPNAWARTNVDLRVTYESVTLPGDEKMGLVGASYLAELHEGLCVGPAVYGAASGERGGLFTVGAEAALCIRLAGPLALQTGLYVGGGGGGGAPVGGGLMLRPHADLLWDFGGYRLGVSISNVRFPSGEINSTQFGLVLAMNTKFVHLPGGTDPMAYFGGLRTGVGFDRILGVAGAYRPASDALGKSGAPLGATIGTVGMRADHFFTPNFFGGIEANAAASGGAAGYAEFLGTLGLQWPVGSDRFTLGGRVALGMGGGGDVPTGGGLLGKAALDAALRLSRNVSLNLEAGWARAPQGSFSAPFGSLALMWDLDHGNGAPTVQTREEFASGIETYHLAARKKGPPATLDNVTLKFNRFVSESFYLTGQVHSAYAGDAGGFSVGLIGVGVQQMLGEHVLVGAELLAGAAGGGGVDTGNGAVVQPMAYVGVDLSRSLSLRLGAGRVMSGGGGLDSNVLDLTLAFSFGVASRP
ncbi:MAG: hypothetical protein KDG44_15305 [Burkholderiaceae bacterium]|nr:hypothetical protein [Burkholderiaceae bacterium]